MANMQDNFLNGLSAMYNTEKITTEGLPQMLQGISSPEVKQALEQHGEETKTQQQRLEQIFQQMGQTPNDIQPKGILGIIEENNQIQKQGYDPATQDASILAAAQRIEHYEIAGYGTLVTYAKQLGNQQAADLLGQTLQEEKNSDQKLTQIAEQSVNQQAAQTA